MKLYVCWGTFPSPRPGGHPCGNAYKALREAGHDPARVRPGAVRAAVEGRLLVTPEVAREVEEAGGDLDDNGSSLVLSRSVSAEGRSRAFAGGHSVPVSLLQVLADDLVAVHGQSDQQQLLKPGRQRDALDRFGGPELAVGLEETGEQDGDGLDRERVPVAELRQLRPREISVRRDVVEVEADRSVGHDSIYQ